MSEPEPPWDVDRRTAAVVAAPIGCHLLREDSQVVERSGWFQVFTPSCASSSLNEVVFSVVGERELEATIDATIEPYRAAGVRFKWCVGPWSRPAATGAALERRGFSSWDVAGMAADPARLTTALGPAPSVERVAPDDAERFLRVCAAGWDVADGELPSLRAALASALTRLDGALELFIVLDGDEPVGAASHVLKPDGSGYLCWGVVLPAFRGRGHYRALLAARLARLAELGVGLATTQARALTSAPILERLGFETLFRSRCYELAPGDPHLQDRG